MPPWDFIDENVSMLNSIMILFLFGFFFLFCLKLQGECEYCLWVTLFQSLYHLHAQSLWSLHLAWILLVYLAKKGNVSLIVFVLLKAGWAGLEMNVLALRTCSS